MVNLSLNHLYDHWRIAHNGAKRYEKLAMATGADADAVKFANWNHRMHCAYAEIERRADLLPFALIEQLIETGASFTFNNPKL